VCTDVWIIQFQLTVGWDAVRWLYG
jgi:hypothetical protein